MQLQVLYCSKRGDDFLGQAWELVNEGITIVRACMANPPPRLLKVDDLERVPWKEQLARCLDCSEPSRELN